MAFGQSEGGSDWSTYHVRELPGGRQLPDTIRWVKFSSLSWTKDGKGFFYGRYPEPPAGKALEVAVRDKRIYYHVLGTPQSADRLIYERPAEPTLFIDASLDETGRYLFIDTNKGTSNKNELFVKDLASPLEPSLDAPVTPLYPGHTAAYIPLGVVSGRLYLLTDRDAPNRKVVAVPFDTPDPANWTTIVPESRHAIDTATLVAGHFAVNALEDVTSAITLYTLDGKKAHDVTPPGLGAMSGPFGRNDRPEIFYTFTSPLHPTTVFRFDPATGTSTPFLPPALTFDPSRYETERIFYQSRDGTRVPMFITHRKGLPKNGGNPTMLYAYGGFDIATLPTFRPDVPAWLERGGVWATANIRGGSEYGEAWHEAGMHEKKQNVFDDFIAAAEYLVREKWASPATLGIMGASNGGLLVGAVMEQRPDLFAVALPAVGVMDMLRYHKFTGGDGVGDRIRIVGRPGGVQVPLRVLAAAEHQAGHVLSGNARDDGRPRRPRRAEPLVQIHRHAPGRAGVRAPGSHPRRDGGLARLSADRQTDRGTGRRVELRRREYADGEIGNAGVRRCGGAEVPHLVLRALAAPAPPWLPAGCRVRVPRSDASAC